MISIEGSQIVRNRIEIDDNPAESERRVIHVASGAAVDESVDFESRQRLACGSLLSRADHDIHLGDAGMAGECLDRPAQHRLAGEITILLGNAAAEPLSASGGDDECGDRQIEPFALSLSKGCLSSPT